MKIVNSEELIEILKATTAEEITLTTSTEVKMNKRGNSLVENGNKVTKTTSATYQFGGSYEERINESIDSSIGYKAKPLPWGSWVNGAEGKVIKHTKTDKEGNETTNYYLRYYNPTSEVSTTTFVDGKFATDEQMKIINQFTPKKKETKVVTESGTEVENKVKTNVVNFANIVTIEIDGEVYKVED